MIASRLEDSTYYQYYNMYKILMQDEIAKPGVIVNEPTSKIPGEEIKNAVGKVCAVKYETPGTFHYCPSGGRFTTFAFQIVSEGSLDYRLYVSIDGVNWDDKVRQILLTYVDEKFNVGSLSGGTIEKPVNDVFYYNVVGRMHYRIDVTNVKGKYYVIALD